MQNEYAGQIIFIECNKIISPIISYNDRNILRLSENIKKNGLLQPISVRPVKYGLYEIITGKRRLIASKLAGIKSVPCVVMNIDDKKAAAFNFIENSFNNELNYFDEALIIKNLILENQYTIDEIAKLISVDIYEIINKLKILHFSNDNIIKIKNADLTFSQCKSLLKLENTEYLDEVLNIVIDNNFNDFQTEDFINKFIREKRNTAIFKDIRIFINTFINTVNKMNSAGIKTEISTTENKEKTEILITISKQKIML